MTGLALGAYPLRNAPQHTKGPENYRHVYGKSSLQARRVRETLFIAWSKVSLPYGSISIDEVSLHGKLNFSCHLVQYKQA